MDDFIYQTGTKIYFGVKAVLELGQEVRKDADKVLLVYGCGSVKKNGSYDDVRKSLTEHGIGIYELPGVSANPDISSVRAGVKICKEEKVGAVVALGGGSVIDCAKTIAAGACYAKDPWDFVIHIDGAEKALPIFAVPTLAATGSEMNGNAVISNRETHEKYGWSSPLLRPKVSFLNPKYAFSATPWQTASGTADILSHLMEQYFGDVAGGYIQDRLNEALMKTCVHFGPIVLQKPDDYEARANLMWASSLALSGLIKSGHSNPWAVHDLEHPLSAYYGVTHGAGLAVLTPNFLRYALSGKTAKRIGGFAVNVFMTDPSGKDDMALANESIVLLEGFFASLGLPGRLRDLQVGNDKFAEMARQACRGGKIGSPKFALLGQEDAIRIYQASY